MFTANQISGAMFFAYQFQKTKPIRFERPRYIIVSKPAQPTVLVHIKHIRELQREGRDNGVSHVSRGMLEFWRNSNIPYYKGIFATKTALVLFYASSRRSTLATKPSNI